MTASQSLYPDVPSSNAPDPLWSGLVERIRSGEPEALQELYQIFSKGIRFLLCRQLGPQDLDDRVHDAFVIITQSIRRGDLREPERLMGYIRTIVRRQAAAHIENMVQSRRNCNDADISFSLTDQRPTPEQSVIANQRMELALRILKSFPDRDREVLVRFYLKEQSVDEICRDLNLTETQFRLIKSRAKSRFGELGRRRFALRTGFHSQEKNRNE
jgi:RNA polymerase sigma-70 factor (ECF subfamily)